jgi:hypothetical protein
MCIYISWLEISVHVAEFGILGSEEFVHEAISASVGSDLGVDVLRMTCLSLVLSQNRNAYI